MEKSDKQELIAVIEEMCSPLLSAGDLQLQSDTDSGSNASYSLHDTVEKRPVSEGDSSITDSTEKKFTCSSGSEDSDSDVDEDTMYPIKDKISLVMQIEKLQKEQEELKQKQQIHEKHIRELLEREPYVNMHFKSLRSSYSSETNPKLFTQLKSGLPLSTSSNWKQQHPLLTEEHIYVQLEQLYANFHVLHFPSKAAQFLLNGQKGNSFVDAGSVEEIKSLKNKIKELERKLSCSTHKNLPQPHILKPARGDGRLDDIASPYSSQTLIGVSGRPVSPVPLPPMPADFFPTEVTFKWIISNYSKKLRQEKLDEGHKEVSWPFYMTHCGYRAQAEVYLNGNGTGTNRCMSVFLRIIKGDYDRHLKWPVNLQFVVILVNQSDDHTDSLKAGGNQFQYTKPWGVSDGESDCWGLVEFVSHDMIKQRNYIHDDKIELKIRMLLL
ncbi:unnamed protein product [Candidula unifasciata]|uniref:MATH domain-containing protein n=1 Tax=Candidula unifasciata TaxID=100452 RepID=A0A8S3Z7H6_9EUPU|nr:unnamed protein product [Candidula unifasciata]